jgi:hypothetical protein
MRRGSIFFETDLFSGRNMRFMRKQGHLQHYDHTEQLQAI